MVLNKGLTMKYLSKPIVLMLIWIISFGVSGADSPPAQDAISIQKNILFAQLEHLDAIQEGANGATHKVYVFFDANCYYCQLTWRALQYYEKVGLQVRWVPVAYQQPSSIGRAAAIMQAQDRVSALRENETQYAAAQYNGGIRPATDVSDALKAQFLANTLLMNKFGAPGTPLLVWKDVQGNVQINVGVPRLSELPVITGLPLQAIKGREFDKFK